MSGDTPNPIDFRKLLTFFEGMYAHTLTLQELVAHDDERTYEQIYPKYEIQAAQQFAVFYRALDQPEAFATAVREFLHNHPKSGKVH